MDQETAPGIPMWVKVMGGILLVVLLAFLALHLTGKMPHH